MNNPLVLYKVENNIAYLSLNRPEKCNALNPELVSALKQALQNATQDANAKVIVLQAEGTAFCAGADLQYIQSMQKFSYEENLADSSHLKALFELIYFCPKIVIAQVQGTALAGGCGLVSVADFAFATPEAQFGYTEVRIGFVPAIVTLFLIRKVGEMKAKHLLLTAELIDATTAQNYGLIHEVVPAQNLATRVQEFAQKLIKQNSTQAMATTKQLIAQISSQETRQALQNAAELNAQARSSADCQRGIAAFLNKQPITW